MPVLIEKPIETVKRVKIQIGDEWSEVCFGKAIPREDAVVRARQILEAMAK